MGADTDTEQVVLGSLVDIIGPDTSYLVSFSPATFCPLF